jgi:methionyl-tRNA formyltransferase
MRILILSNLDWPSVDALTRLRPQLMQDEVTVMLSKRVGRVPAVSKPYLAELSQADRAGWMALLGLAGVSKDDLEETVRSTLADVLACPVAFADGINAPAGISRVQAFAPDLIVSIRFGEILRRPVIRSARFGVLNLHSGLLPAFRGVMATFWAMLGSAPRYGTTLHWIEDSGIDSGTIISEAAQPLDLGNAYLSNTLALYPAGIEMLSDAIGSLRHGQRLPGRLPKGEGAYFSYPTPAAVRAFLERGYRLVD